MDIGNLCEWQFHSALGDCNRKKEQTSPSHHPARCGHRDIYFGTCCCPHPGATAIFFFFSIVSAIVDQVEKKLFTRRGPLSPRQSIATPSSIGSTHDREREGEDKRARKTQTFHNSESPPTEMRIDWTLCRPTAALSIFNGSSILLLNFVSFLRHFDGNPVTPQRSRHFRNGRKASPHFPSAPKSKKRRQNGRVSPPKTKRLLRSSSRSKGNYSNQGMTSLNASAVYISYLSQTDGYILEKRLSERKKSKGEPGQVSISSSPSLPLPTGGHTSARFPL